MVSSCQEVEVRAAPQISGVNILARFHTAGVQKKISMTKIFHRHIHWAIGKGLSLARWYYSQLGLEPYEQGVKN